MEGFKGVVTWVLIIVFTASTLAILSSAIDEPPFIVIIIILMMAVGLSTLLATFVTNTIFDGPSTVIKKIKEYKDFSEDKRYTRNQLSTYQKAKKDFSYLSDDTLIAKYDSDAPLDKDNLMFQLALEEILVERGLIKFSPLHEKMDAIENWLFQDEESAR
jgi:hypothetical protein